MEKTSEKMKVEALTVKRFLVSILIVLCASGLVGANPKMRSTKASADEQFMWRVDIESLGGGRGEEEFLKVIELIEKVGEKSFEYENTIYNKESLRLLLLRKYPNHRYGNPIEFFIEQYEWYKENIVAKDKQLYWLNEFIEYLSFMISDYWSTSDKNIKKVLSTEYRDLINEILEQVMVLSYEEEAKDYLWAYSAFNWGGMFGFEFEVVLGNLDRFLSSWADQMTEGEKEVMIDWVISNFADNDLAVKIYAKLRP